MITVYQFPGRWGLPNASPFCLKVETYLRMMELPYENRFVQDPRRSPKGKLPFVKCEAETVADSELIIDLLKKKYGDPLDKHLSEEERAIMFMLENLFAERLYWFMLYFRWKNEVSWQYIKKSFFKGLSPLVKYFVAHKIRKKMLASVYNQGTSRHTNEEILFLAQKTIDALAVKLGSSSYFMGSSLASVDATAFAFLANIAWVPFEDPLKNIFMSYPNLIQYTDMMWRTFYPELQQPFLLNLNNK